MFTDRSLRFAIILLMPTLFQPLWAQSIPPSTVVLQNLDTADTLCVSVHPGGQWLITGHSDGMVQIREAETGYLLHTITFGNKPVRQILFSSGGERFAASDGEILKVYGFPSRTLLGEYTKEINFFSWTPEGRLLLSVGNQGTLVDLAGDCSGHPVMRTLLSLPIKRFQLAPDGKRIAVQRGDDRVIIYDWPGAKPLYPDIRLDGTETTPGPWVADFERNRILLSYNGFGTGYAEWRDMKTGKAQSRSMDFNTGIYGRFTDVLVLADGKKVILSGSGGSHYSFLTWVEGHLFEWEGKKSRELNPWHTGIKALAFIPGIGRIVVCGGVDPSGPPEEWRKLSCWNLGDLQPPVEGPQEEPVTKRPVWTVWNPLPSSEPVVFCPTPHVGGGELLLIRSGRSGWQSMKTLRVWDITDRRLVSETRLWDAALIIPDNRYGSVLVLTDQGAPEGDPVYGLSIFDPMDLSLRQNREYPWRLELSDTGEWVLIDGDRSPETKETINELYEKVNNSLWYSELKNSFVTGGIIRSDGKGCILLGDSRLYIIPGRGEENSRSRWILIGPDGTITLSDPSLASEFRITEGMTSLPWQP